METISVKNLRPIRVTAKTLVFEDTISGETFMATRRVANDILTNAVDEVFIVKIRGEIRMLATPSCW